MKMLLHSVAVLLLLAAAVWAGLVLGEKTVPPATVLEDSAREQQLEKHAPPEDIAPDWGSPPLHLFVDGVGPDTREVLLREVALAASAGVHRHIVRGGLSWQGKGELAEEFLGRVEAVLQVDPAAVITLYIDLNAPPDWFQEHTDGAALIDGRPRSMVSVASESWRMAMVDSLEELAGAAGAASFADHIDGCVLACLEDGRWYLPPGYDRSAANVEGWRRWLTDRYGNPETLAAAWNIERIDWADVPIPPEHDQLDTAKVFFDPQTQQDSIDYLRYVSENTRQAILLAAHTIREMWGEKGRIIVPYGHSFELISNAAGHGDLQTLLNSSIDAFASPVAYTRRASGGPGGFMGPVDSARNRGKQWLILDDTRIGMGQSGRDESLAQLRTLQAQDVYNVQLRNFGAALAHGLELAWVDTGGRGDLDSPEVWQGLGTLVEAHRRVTDRPPADRQNDAETRAHPLVMGDRVSITVAVDEESRFYHQAEQVLNSLALTNTRDAVLQTGEPAQFCLVNDVIEMRETPSSIYIFPNAFQLSAQRREQLHSVLAARQATAIWLYAPGYITDSLPVGEESEQDVDDTQTQVSKAAPRMVAGVENIAATVRMGVQAFDGSAKSGSRWLLGGAWLAADEAFGESISWQPLFYIDDDDTNACARYRDSDEVSAALRFLPEGWTTCYMADPQLTPEVLRELLKILELHQFLNRSFDGSRETLYYGPQLLAIHAANPGERLIDLGDSYDVVDLVQADAGWRNRNTLSLRPDMGQTRLFLLNPAADT